MRSPGMQARPLPLEVPTLKMLKKSGLVHGGLEQTPAPFQTMNLPNIPHHLLFCVSKGGYRLYGKDATLDFKQGDMLVVPASARRQISLRSRSGSHLFLHFDPGNCRLDFPAAPSIVSTSYVADLMDTAERIIRYVHQGRGASMTLAAKSAEMLLHILKDLLTPSAPQPAYDFSALWSEVSGAIDREWSIEELANLLGVSASHFHALCKEQMGCTPHHYLTQLRMEQAQGLLLQTDFSLEAIAHRVGYRTAFSFSKAFVAHYGQRPGRYRRSGGELS